MQYIGITKKYSTARTFVAERNIPYFMEGFFMQICIALILILGFLYVFEINGVMSFERDVLNKQSIITAKGQDLSKLEIAAAQLESAERIQHNAQTEHMVSLAGATYVSLNENPVAFNQ